MLIISIITILALIILLSISIYNKYVALDEENNTAFSDLGTFLQKRLDLIPNLVETVKGYAKHEDETLNSVIKARANMINIDYTNIDNVEKIQNLENELKSTLKSIFALNEAYPDLKANHNFISLQNSLSSIETEIVSARRYYNATARELNVFTRKFPNNIFASLFKFRKAQLFKEDEEAKSVPKVKF